MKGVAREVSPRMFRNNLLEALSRVHPSVPLFIFVPVIMVSLYFSKGLPILLITTLFSAGLFFWTLTEYLMHRFIFHFEMKSVLGKRIHFIFHGVHHDYPNDPHRLVMPPSLSIPLSALFFFLFKIILGIDWTFPFFAGFMLGYLIYDMLHYAIHHLNFQNYWFRKIKEKHMKHHFLDPNAEFGVSSGIWDYFFGTFTSKVKDALVKEVEI